MSKSFNLYSVLRLLLHSSSLSMLLLSTLFYASCTFDKEEELNDCSLFLNATISEVAASRCNQSTGSFLVKTEFDPAFEGVVSYRINNGSLQTDPRFENLSAGVYAVEAVVDEECFRTLSVTIQNEDGLGISLDLTESDCGTATGKINIQANNSVGTLTFKLDGGAEVSNSEFSNLSPGTYQITVADDNCEIQQEVIIKSNVTLAVIKDITDSNCATAACHGGSVDPDMREEDNIISFANRIRARTSEGTMPPSSTGNELDEETIETIACWANDLE